MNLQRILQEIMKKNNTWNIRRLVDESFVPVTQRILLKIVGFQDAITTIKGSDFKLTICRNQPLFKVPPYV